MGHFSNGTEGMRYEEQYCNNCSNWINRDDDDVKSCPIMDAHFWGNADQGGDSEAGKSLKMVLDTLIPREGIYNGVCSMFTPRESIEKKRDYFRDVLSKGKPTLGQWAYEMEGD